MAGTAMIDTTILLGKQLLFNVGVEYPNKKKKLL